MKRQKGPGHLKGLATWDRFEVFGSPYGAKSENPTVGFFGECLNKICLMEKLMEFFMDLLMDFVDTSRPYGGKQHVLYIYLSAIYLFLLMKNKTWLVLESL